MASMRWTPLLGIGDNEVLELTHVDRSRIFNLGYFAQVEQQGVQLEAFERRERVVGRLHRTLPPHQRA